MSGGGRRVVLGVSLKLYLDPVRAEAWAEEVGRIAATHPAVTNGLAELFVLPSLPALAGVRRALGSAPVAVGAQDLFWEDRGPWTGAVSGADLVAVGCRLVEVGHAERRRWFGEDDAIVGRKLAAAFRNGLRPVLCIGERDRQDAPAAAAAAVRQLESVLEGVEPGPAASIVVAYEPEWAIGAEEAASPEHVAVVCAALRTALEDRPAFADVSVIYGGSAQPGLLPRLGPSVDGLFLGRFAHDPAALGLILDEAMALA